MKSGSALRRWKQSKLLNEGAMMNIEESWTELEGSGWEDEAYTLAMAVLDTVEQAVMPRLDPPYDRDATEKIAEIRRDILSCPGHFNSDLVIPGVTR